MDISIGDLITRKSYEHDKVFRVVEVSECGVLLAEEDVRLIADAPLHDVVKIDEIKRETILEQADEQTAYAF
jgi:spore coat assembly protein